MMDRFTDFNLNQTPILLDDFDERILYTPAKECKELQIITGFTDCERIATHMITLGDGIKEKIYSKDLKVQIIVGMSKSSISLKKHNNICRLIEQLNSTRNMPKVECYYISEGKEVHSKMYIWSKDYVNPLTNKTEDKLLPYIAFCGSLNYTMNAFYKRRESVVLCNPLLANKYFDDLLADSVNCFDKEALNRLKNNTVNGNQPIEIDENDESEYDDYDKKQTPIDTLQVSLLTADGTKTGHGSGVNWGIRPNRTKRDLDQAYIPYNVADRKEGFFPDRLHPDDKNCPIFRVITKDYGTFHMRMAQANNKGLHSAESNAILGKWLRKRLQIPSGEFITKKMLEDYGKTYVTFRKYSDGTYLLDF